RRGVAGLVELLADGDAELACRAEEMLLRVAREDAPQAGTGAGTLAERKVCRADWREWLTKKGDGLDLAKLDLAPPFFRYTLIPEIHGGRIWQPGPDGKQRWELKNANMPRDAQWLPGNRVLVCEVNTNRIAEYNLEGKLLWSPPCNDPAYAVRLGNGNTFISSHAHSFEVTPDGKEVYSHHAQG